MSSANSSQAKGPKLTSHAPHSHLHHNHVSRVMSPSRVNRPCSPSPCRRMCQTSGEDDKPAIPRWKGGRGRVGGNVNTRLPRFTTARGKENIRGRGGVGRGNIGRGGARIAKPIVTVKKFSKEDVNEAQNVLIEISKENSILNGSPS